MRARKKPVEVEAHIWHKNGDHPEDYLHDREGFDGEDFRVWPASYAKDHDWEGEVVRRYRSPDDYGDRPCEHCNREMNDHGWIDTLEGGHIVCPGDYIITGVDGEKYPCKPSIFNKTYELISDDWMNLEGTSYCCHECFKRTGGRILDRMITCPNCGNKRCPKATDHNLGCTGINDSGQPGSIY